MCTPSQVVSTITSAASAVKGASDIYIERKNAKYQEEIALNNARQMAIEAQELKQQGLEEARQERLKGIEELNKQKAKNAASGFDMNSMTNLLQYDDIETRAENNAISTMNNYNSKAKNYYLKAQGYLQDASSSISNYNKYLFNKGIRGLGQLSSVSENWTTQKDDYLW